MAALLLTAPLAAQAPVILKDNAGWVGAVAFSPDGKHLAVGTSDGAIGVWEVPGGKKVVASGSHQDAVSALAWSKDGKQIVSGSHDGTAIRHVPALERRSMTVQVPYESAGGAVLSIALGADGKRGFAGKMDGTIREWAPHLNVEVAVYRHHTSWINGLALDRTGARIASASSDNTVQVRGVKEFDELHTFRVREGEVRSVAFAPDGKSLAAGIRYGTVRVWHLESKKEVSLQAHVGETWAVAFTPDGKTLVSGGGDWNKPSQVRLWDTASWKERAALPHSGEVLCLAISPDGRWLAAGSWDRTVRVWDLTRIAAGK
jgi:WD40 repeat protein